MTDIRRLTGASRQGSLVAFACCLLALAAAACTPHTNEPSPRAATDTAHGPQESAAEASQGDAASAARSGGRLRVLSWNVSSDAFVRDPAAFAAMVRRARPDILLLDEVNPSTNENQLREALARRAFHDQDTWYVDFGSSGGRQRGVLVSRLPMERLSEFAGVLPYPEPERLRLLDRMRAADEVDPAYSMDGGIPVNGAVVLAGGRRLLVVVADLQCCGGDPGSWQEDRRRVEVREIRRRVRQVLERARVDGLIVAGDFNLVSTPLPLIIAAGPYSPPHAGLLTAELYHLDGVETWTWDGRGTPFPSRAMDFQLYSPCSLELVEGAVLDSADLPPAELEDLGIDQEAAARLSSHRPLVAEYAWR